MTDAAVREKAAIRERMLAARSRQPFVARFVRSRAACRRAASLSVFARPRVVLGYFPVRGEADVRSLLAGCLERGIVLGLPRSIGRGRRRDLSFRSVGTLAGLKPGRFGIPEPAGGEEVDAGRADVIVVPGLAFSPAGERIGYGGGYYDRVLGRRRGIAVGVAFECQILPGLPQDSGDVPVDVVVTERRVLIPGRARGR